jgi:hypothetical protein
MRFRAVEGRIHSRCRQRYIMIIKQVAFFCVFLCKQALRRKSRTFLLSRGADPMTYKSASFAAALSKKLAVIQGQTSGFFSLVFLLLSAAYREALHTFPLDLYAYRIFFWFYIFLRIRPVHTKCILNHTLNSNTFSFGRPRQNQILSTRFMFHLILRHLHFECKNKQLKYVQKGANFLTGSM